MQFLQQKQSSVIFFRSLLFSHCGRLIDADVEEDWSDLDGVTLLQFTR